jgi:hypothetical protein
LAELSGQSGKRSADREKMTDFDMDNFLTCSLKKISKNACHLRKGANFFSQGPNFVAGLS